jgi:hypothetical protein
MPKLVGTPTQTQITIAAVALQVRATGRKIILFFRKL